jgi:predicted Zn-dependent protease with MMP-like domain
VSKERFSALVETALSELPEPFNRALEEVTVELRARPTRSQLKTVGLRQEDLLLGLYSGVPLTHRHVEAPSHLPDKIELFQEDIELVSLSEEELIEQVRVTVLHELGHHFGMDEDDLERLGYR